MKRRMIFWIELFALLVLFVACEQSRSTSSYTPHTRTFTLITVPLLVRESTNTYAFLKQDFASGGVLAGKEVYAFSPDQITVYQGDTVQITFVNPENDPHTFTLPAFNVSLALTPQAVTKGHFLASKVGVFTFLCTIPSHMPFMSGQLTVLPDTAAT